MWSPVSVPYPGWSIIIGFATIFLIDFVMSKLSFLPDWLGNTFDLLQSGWLGILCISVLGPIRGDVVSRGNHESAAAEVQSGKGYYIVGAYLRDFSY